MGAPIRIELDLTDEASSVLRDELFTLDSGIKGAISSILEEQQKMADIKNATKNKKSKEEQEKNVLYEELYNVIIGNQEDSLKTDCQLINNRLLTLHKTVASGVSGFKKWLKNNRNMYLCTVNVKKSKAYVLMQINVQEEGEAS